MKIILVLEPFDPSLFSFMLDFQFEFAYPLQSKMAWKLKQRAHAIGLYIVIGFRSDFARTTRDTTSRGPNRVDPTPKSFH